MIAGPPAAPARRPYPLPGFSGRDDLLGWSLLPSARPGPRASAVRAAPLLPGPGSGVRRSRQATQLRTSGSKHSAWTHCVGAGPSLPLRLLAARPMLPGPHTQLGLRPASAPEEETWGRGGHRPRRPAPPPAGWDHSPPEPQDQHPDLFLSAVPPFNHSTIPPAPPRQAPAGPWDGAVAQARPALGSRGWAPRGRAQTSGGLLCPVPKASPKAQVIPASAPLLWEPFCLPRQFWFRSSNT